MKNLWRKIAAGALALAMVFSLAACANKNQPSGGDAAAAMLNARQEMEKISSMRYTYAMELAISAEGESVEMTVNGSAEMTMDPAAVKMTMNMDMMGMALENIQIYVVPENGQMVTYVGMDMEGTGQNQWYKTLAEDATISTEQYNAVDSFELYMENGSDFKAAGKETVQGVSATRYEGVIGSDVLEETLEKSGNLDNIGSLLGKNYSDGLAKMGGIPITIWISDAGLPVKYVFDMTSMMAELIKNTAEDNRDAGVSVDKVMMSMEVEGYNDISAITVPQEALDSAANMEN